MQKFTLHSLTNQDSDEDSSYAGYCDEDGELGGRVNGDTITFTTGLPFLNLPDFKDWASTRIPTSWVLMPRKGWSSPSRLHIFIQILWNVPNPTTLDLGSCNIKIMFPHGVTLKQFRNCLISCFFGGMWSKGFTDGGNFARPEYHGEGLLSTGLTYLLDGQETLPKMYYVLGRFHVKGPRKKVNVKKWIFF